MCGIAGEVLLEPRSEAPSAVEQMVGMMRQRGPDDHGVRRQGGATLGMCRLAIVDIAGGQQPMATADGRWTIVYNGEVYNARELRHELESQGVSFRTRSDTEVVLQALASWGTAGLDRLNGMFALALWDRDQESLLLARDRLGIKPLYYWSHAKGLAFSSVATAFSCLKEFRPDIDPQAVELYLATKFIPAPHSIFQHVRKLPPGHWALWRNGRLNIQSWWDVPLDDPAAAGDIDQSAQRIGELLDDAVRMRLISERPVGLCLSGGIDSGLIASSLAHGGTEAFSLAFGKSDFDEADVARQVAGNFELKHRVLEAASLDVDRQFSAMVAQLDEPLGDSSCLALYTLSQLIREHVTVVLSGTGGDEVFGGYLRYAGGVLANYTRWLPGLRLLPRCLGRDDRKLGWRGKLSRFAGPASLPPLRCMEALIAPLPESRLDGMRQPDFRRSLQGFSAHDVFDQHERRARGSSQLTRLMYTDIKTVLPDDYLFKEDRMTMAHSLEGRLPLLDFRLVEQGFRLPDRWKIRGLATKRLLRRVARQRLLRQIAKAPKQGFEIPAAQWLRGPLRNRLQETLCGSQTRLADYLAPADLEEAVDAHLSGRANDHRFLWTALVLEHWLAAHS